MRILFMSCHSVLEFDEIKLLNELGHEVFSPGAYVEPLNPGDASLRPGISDLTYDPDIVEQYNRIGAQHPGQDGKNHLTKEFVNNFDLVWVMHIPSWITNNWEAIKHKKVVWRTIGQSIAPVEAQLKPYRQQGMQIVRYSPMERNIPGYIGEDAMIRFYKDPNDYRPWTGQTKEVITVAQHMKQRHQACNFNIFEFVTRPFPRKLFGPGSEEVGSWGMGKVPFDELLRIYRNNRVYFYTGTHPASYTLNFIESFITGTPIVAIGSQFGNASYFPGHDLYEIPHLITTGVDGFVSDNFEELRQFIRLLLNNDALAQTISTNARKKAIEIFGKGRIKEEWRRFLDGNL